MTLNIDKYLKKGATTPMKRTSLSIDKYLKKDKGEIQTGPSSEVYEVPEWMGGGSYQGTGDLKYDELQKYRSERDVSQSTKTEVRGGSFKETEKEVDHIVSLFFGGTNEKDNLQGLENKKSFTQSVWDVVSRNDRQASAYKTRQDGKYEVEKRAIEKYRNGEIGLGQARLAIINYKNEDLVATYLGEEKGFLSKARDFFGGAEEKNIAYKEKYKGQADPTIGDILANQDGSTGEETISSNKNPQSASTEIAIAKRYLAKDWGEDITNPINLLSNVFRSIKTLISPRKTKEEMVEADRASYLSEEMRKERAVNRAKNVASYQKDLPEDYKEPGVIGQFFDGLKEMTIRGAAALSASGQVQGVKRNNIIIQEQWEGIEDFFNKKLMERPELSAPEDMGKWKDPVFYSRMIGGIVPSIAMAFGTTAAVTFATRGNLVAGLAAGFETTKQLEGGFAFKEALSYGATQEQAANVHEVVGNINGMLEMIPVGKLLNKTPGGQVLKKKIIKRIIKEGLEQGVFEGTTEGTQEFVNNVILSEFDENRGLFDGVLESFVGGLIAGKIMGSSAEALSILKDPAVREQAEMMLEDKGFDLETLLNGKDLEGTPAKKTKLNIDKYFDKKEEVPTEKVESEEPLIKEDKKYKSAEEFVNRDTGLMKEPGVWESTAKTKAVVKTKEGADKTKSELEDQLFIVMDKIKEQGGKQKADSHLILQKADAIRGIKAIDNVYESLPTKSQLIDIWKKSQEVEAKRKEGAIKTITLKELETKRKDFETFEEFEEKYKDYDVVDEDGASYKIDDSEVETLRGTKGMTADDIMKTYPNIKLKRDVVAKDVYGNKAVIPEGEKLTPYEMKDGKILLQDGETYLVSKNQFANIKGNTIGGEAKPFAPELKGTEETVKGYDISEDDIDILLNDEIGEGMTREEAIDFIKTGEDNMDRAPKYSDYQLPNGENYKEILIKAPQEKITTDSKVIDKFFEKIGGVKDVSDMTTSEKKEYKDIIAKQDSEIDKKVKSTFKSSHWDEKNILSHLRMNERTYEGKPVTFMEELQSDWASEGRDKGFAKDNKIEWKKDGEELYTEIGDRSFGIKPEGKRTDGTFDKFYVWEDGGVLGHPASSIADAKAEVARIINEGVPNNPLLKNWQEMSVKRALQEAVNSKSAYFAWINGEQTSARYNLATYIENVQWDKNKPFEGEDLPYKFIIIKPKGGGNNITVSLNKDGSIQSSSNGDWQGKKLDEVLGKGLADKIMAKDTGTLSGEGLNFGGEWAVNLYDKQVANIVKKLTGAEIIEMDMGLPVSAKKESWYTTEPSGDYRGGNVTKGELTSENMKVGEIVKNGSGKYYVITEVLGDGKFVAKEKDHMGEPNSEMYKKTFSLSSPTTVQQGIELTPDVVAKIKGEAPVIKTSGKMFEEKYKDYDVVDDDGASYKIDDKIDEDISRKTVRNEFSEGMVARERFKIPELEKISFGGTGTPKKESTPPSKESQDKEDNDKKFSLHYERVKEIYPALDSDGLEIGVQTQKEQLKWARDYIQRNPENAIKIAYGTATIQSGKNLQIFRGATIASLYADGKTDLADMIAKRASLSLTESARELSAANMDLYPQDKPKIELGITQKRLELLGAKLGEVDPTKMVQRAKEKIKTETKKVSDKIQKMQSETTEQKLTEIDSIINELLC